MKAWSAVHDAIKVIQNRAREEFKFEVTDAATLAAINGLIELRLSEMISGEFNSLSTKELLIAAEILQTDKRVLERAQVDRKNKSKGDLN